jgi:transposase-like protein
MTVTRTDAYANGTETQKNDRESPQFFYDLPAEHWQYLRTTNAVEPVFGTARRRKRLCVGTVVNSICS